MIDLNLLSADLDYVINDLPITMTIGSTSYIGTQSDITKSKTEEVTGYLINYDLSIYLRLLDFGSVSALPSIGSKVTISNVIYRIENITIGSDNLGVIFNLIKE